MQNKHSVFVVQTDTRKDLKDAERFGQIKELFGNVGRNYNQARMIEHARRVLSNWSEGDSLLMMGDPALCGVALAVATEFDSAVTVLSWDKYDFQYVARRWDFGPDSFGVNPGALAS